MIELFRLSPLHVAAGSGDEFTLNQLLQELVQQGSSCDIADAVGRTPLFFAVLSGSDLCTSILIQYDHDTVSAPMIMITLPLSICHTQSPV